MMSSGEITWESLLHTDAPPGCSLKRALFTTYDKAEESVLVEHLLPVLLRLSREPDGEGTERTYFLLELDQRLKQLHDRLVVVSSAVREEPEPEHDTGVAYRWIWRSIRHLTVGSRGKAVQHAKLWLLHWSAPEGGGSEYVEIVVSSANLTLPAFRGQLQAAWRALLELRPQPSDARRRGWGVLPPFLQELAASAGDARRLDPFVDLLARAECPPDTTFVASVPGTHPRGHRWGREGLRAIAPPGHGAVKASILCPYVGSWEAPALERWCGAFAGTTRRLQLIWIDNDHPWARSRCWILPRSSLKALSTAGASILRHHLDPEDQESSNLFHDDHRAADERWCHAKLYAFHRGRARRLLVTSANFSPAAWGAEKTPGALTIQNFELGVCVEQASWPFDDLLAFDDLRSVATCALPPATGSSAITWAQGEWDGKAVTVMCRCEAGRQLDGRIECDRISKVISEWKAGRDGSQRSARVAWSATTKPPVAVTLTCDKQSLIVPVFDSRPAPERAEAMPDEVSADDIEEMQDSLLFEQYGGRVAQEPDHDDDTDDESDTDAEDAPPEDGRGPRRDGEGGDEPAHGDTDDEVEDEGTARGDSYAVPAFVLARRHLTVVDCWADQVRRRASATTTAFELDLLRRDGEQLIAAFTRQAERDARKGANRALGARLAADEIALRLKHFPEL